MTSMKSKDEISGEVYASAAGTLTSKKHVIAVRAHSLESACKIAKPYQELRNEMVLFLKPLKNGESAGMQSKSKHSFRAFSD